VQQDQSNITALLETHLLDNQRLPHVANEEKGRSLTQAWARMIEKWTQNKAEPGGVRVPVLDQRHQPVCQIFFMHGIHARQAALPARSLLLAPSICIPPLPSWLVIRLSGLSSRQPQQPPQPLRWRPIPPAILFSYVPSQQPTRLPK
jgi:hypothetical protein